jgi:hypothetical protein
MYNLNSKIFERAPPLDARVHSHTGKLRTIARIPVVRSYDTSERFVFELSSMQKKPC